ncbi:TrmH family RNA methyltransferase [Caldicellulosiruptoraceae bacterium PP1]
MEIIKSKDNILIKEIKKLEIKKYRDQKRSFIAEGEKLLFEALMHKKDFISHVLFSESAVENYSEIYNRLLSDKDKKFEVILISDNISDYISDTISSQGIFTIINYIDVDIELLKKSNNIVILNNLQDPGNLGTILRTCSAFGFSNILSTKGSVDIYNSKVIRSSMGSIFHLSIVRSIDSERAIDFLKSNNIKIVVTKPQGGLSLDSINLKDSFALIIGNESNGIDENFEKSADLILTIKMKGNTESLNASVATSIVLYELSKNI